MTTYTELRGISFCFRRLSSNFLNSTYNDASALIQRFKGFIDETPFISELISNTIAGIEYDYHDCFRDRAHGGWSDIFPPVDEKCHVKAMYDYMTAIVDNNANVRGAAMSYCWTEKKMDRIIQAFLNKAFKPLIDYINDAITKEMIVLEEAKESVITQNIENVYGTVNQQGSGTIHSETYVYNEQVEQIIELLRKIMPSLEFISDIPDDALDDVKDDLESVEEQIEAHFPKKNRLQKALAGIKKFASDFSMKLAVSLAASSVTHMDWNALIQKLETYITLLK